jgi:imidazolonepropionase-like amidohydrolase
LRALLFAASIAFRGATVIDGTGAPPRGNMLVVVTGDRIASISPLTPERLARLPAGTEVINAEGQWILPGLIDAHVHAESEDDLTRMLRWGVTSVRLMAEDAAKAVEAAKASRARTDIPDLFPAAPIFTAKGGWWAEEPADPSVNRFPDTPEEAREAVRKAALLGVLEIKLMLDDMGWCRDPKPRLPRLPAPVAAALLSEAATAKLRATVHAPRLDDAREAVAGGATALAHGVLERIDPDTIRQMRERPVFYIPTMGVFEFLADTRGFVNRALDDPLIAASLPRPTLSRYNASAYAKQYRERYPNAEGVRRALPALRENLRALQQAGVPVALGTDMWAFPGAGVSIELDLYVRSGLKALEAIRCATQTAAKSLGADADRGTLAPGKRADLLILNLDPLIDIRNVRAIRAVYKAGVRLSSSTSP